MPIDITTTRGIAAWREQLQGERRLQKHIKNFVPEGYSLGLDALGPQDALRSPRFRKSFKGMHVATSDSRFPFTAAQRRAHRPFAAPPVELASPSRHSYKPGLREAEPTSFTGCYDGFNASWGRPMKLGASVSLPTIKAAGSAPGRGKPFGATRPQTTSAVSLPSVALAAGSAEVEASGRLVRQLQDQLAASNAQVESLTAKIGRLKQALQAPPAVPQGGMWGAGPWTRKADEFAIVEPSMDGLSLAHIGQEI